MLFLVNKPRKRKAKAKAGKGSKARGKTARRTTAKGKARRSSSTIKTRRIGGSMAARKKATRRRKTSARTAAPRRRRRRPATKRRSPVVTLRRRTVYQTNPRRRGGRRRYRRNSPIRGIGNTIISASKDALVVVGGMAGTNLIANRIPYGDGSMGISVAKKIAVALALGMVAQKVASRDIAQKLLLGGFVAAATDVLSAVPVVGPALSGDGDLRALTRGLNSYALPGETMGSYYDPPAMRVPDSAAAYRN